MNKNSSDVEIRYFYYPLLFSDKLTLYYLPYSFAKEKHIVSDINHIQPEIFTTINFYILLQTFTVNKLSTFPYSDVHSNSLGK